MNTGNVESRMCEILCNGGSVVLKGTSEIRYLMILMLKSKGFQILQPRVASIWGTLGVAKCEYVWTVSLLQPVSLY